MSKKTSSKNGKNQAETLEVLPKQSEIENIVATRCRYTEVALVIDPKTTFDEWQAIYGVHKHLRDKANFFLGDVVNFGERSFGEKYSQAVHETGKAYRTLVEISSICERITPERRQPGLSWSHHKSVAYIDDHRKQDRLLKQAAEHGWTVQELTQHAKTPAKAPETPQIDRDQNQPHHTVQKLNATERQQSAQHAPKEEEKHKKPEPKAPEPKKPAKSTTNPVEDDAEIRLEDFVLSIRSIDAKEMKPLRKWKWLKLLEPVTKFIEELKA